MSTAAARKAAMAVIHRLHELREEPHSPTDLYSVWPDKLGEVVDAEFKELVEAAGWVVSGYEGGMALDELKAAMDKLGDEVFKVRR